MRITFTNLKKCFPNMRARLPLFACNRYWRGGIVVLSVKQFTVAIDLRRDWVKDMCAK